MECKGGGAGITDPIAAYSSGSQGLTFDQDAYPCDDPIVKLLPKACPKECLGTVGME